MLLTPRSRRHRQGFTIVELLIVIVVIAILATITIISYNGIVKQAAASALKSDLQQAMTQLNITHVNTNAYPLTVDVTSGAYVLKHSPDTLLEYTSDGTLFHLTASSSRAQTSFHIDTDQSSIVSGADTSVGHVGYTSGAPAPAYPTVAAVGTDQTNGSAAVPSGVTNGSLVILVVGAEWNSGATPTCSTVSSSGFACATVVNQFTDTTWVDSIFLLYKYATSSDTGTYAVTYSQLSGVTVGERGVVALRIANGPTSGSPFVDSTRNAMTPWTNPSYSTGTVSLPSFTPGGNNSLLVAGVWWPDIVTNNTVTVPSGWTKDSDTAGSNGKLTVAHINQTTVAATGALNFVLGAANNPTMVVGTLRLP